MALWQWPVAWEDGPKLGACRSIRSGFDRPFFRLAASGCIDDTTNIACFAVFARLTPIGRENETPLTDPPTTEH